VTDRGSRIAIAFALGFALLCPAVLLMPGRSAPAPAVPPATAPLQVATAPALVAVYERPLFGMAAPGEDAALPADAPTLVGIVGRLGEDAVALVRTAEGSTRALQVGESVDGWQLASLAIDAAFFTRGAERLRVPLPAG
jgi:hypothetical protein